MFDQSKHTKKMFDQSKHTTKKIDQNYKYKLAFTNRFIDITLFSIKK